MSISKKSIDRINQVQHLKESMEKEQQEIATLSVNDSIHENKFKIVSNITQDIPDYLL